MTRPFSLLCLGLLLCFGRAQSLPAEEPAPVDSILLQPLPAGLVMHARILDPARIEGHPLIQRIVRLMETSREWQRIGDESTGLVQLTETLRFADQQLKSLGVENGIRAIWQRGALLAIGEGDNPPVGGIFLAQNGAAAKAFSDLLQQWGETQLGLTYHSIEIDGTPVMAAGDLHFAILEHRVAWANNAAAMKHVLDHVHSNSTNTAVAADPTLLADLHVSLAAVRKNPDFAKPLENPASDFGLLTLFGGWIDLLRRHERFSIGLHASDGDVASLKIGFREATSNRPEALVPYWAHANETIAQPLNPPGTIETFSWYRDYAGLWNNRSQLVAEPTVRMVEQGDEDAGKQLAVFGTRFRPSELISQLGPHYRIVITEQEHVPYDKVEVENVLPAAAFLVDLKDENKFREMVDPFVNLIGLIQGGEQRVLTVREEYKGAQTVSFAYQETDQEVRQRTRDQ